MRATVTLTPAVDQTVRTDQAVVTSSLPAGLDTRAIDRLARAGP